MDRPKQSNTAFWLIFLALVFQLCTKNNTRIVEVSDELSTNPALGNKVFCFNQDYDLADEQNTDLGKVVIANDNDSLYIILKITESHWFMKNAFIFLERDPAITETSNHRPDYEKAAVKEYFDPLKNAFIYAVPNGALNDSSFIAIETNVSKVVNAQETELRKLHLDNGPSHSEIIKYTSVLCKEYPLNGSGATIAFEDYYPKPGDADYNDFIARLHVTEYYTLSNALVSIKMRVEAMARGAIYDHDFRVRIPVIGKSEGAVETFANDNTLISSRNLTGDDAITVSLFPHTKQALPPVGFGERPEMANTEAGTCLVPGQVSILILNLKEPQKNIGGLALSPPYDPILYVNNTKAEIHVLELTKQADADKDGNDDFWTYNGQTFPFGIVAPEFWAWPMERVNILAAYPNFNYVENNDVYTAEPGWYHNPQGDTTYSRPELFDCPAK